MSRNRRRARSKAQKKLGQESVNENNANLETSSNKQSPSDVNTIVDTLMQVDSNDLLLFPEHQCRENVSTTATVSCQNDLLEVESAAELPSTKPKEVDLNPTENHLENNVAGKKKKRKKKKKKNKKNCTAAMTNLPVTLPNAESAVQLPPQEPLQVTFPNAESAVQLPTQELQGLDMNLADNLEVKSVNRKRKKRKKKNLNKPTSNVLDVDSTAKLLAPKHQERDTNLTKIEEKSESGQKSANGKKKRRKKKNLNKPARNVIDVESTAEVLVSEHQERDTSSPNDLEEKTANGRKRKRGENIVKPTSDDQHVELTTQLLPPDNQEKKKKKKRRKVKKAANNKIDNVKTATQDSLSSEREETEALCAGFVKLCPEDVNFVSAQTEHTPNAKETTINCENLENGSYLAFPEKNSVESCSEGTHLPSSAEVTMHVDTHFRRKLLILDLNGLLADIVMPPPKDCKADASFTGRAVFKRPFCDDFLKFCFERFNVAIWSSRSKKIIDRVVDYLLGDLKRKLLFCWDMSHSTMTTFKTLENKRKPLVCKDLRKIWEKHYPDLPWEKGDYDESNTLLLDDSPYKALLNPVHTTIFPYSYNFRLKNDNSLGPGGDLRVYLEKLADAEHVQKYVEEHPFGQRAINEKSASWGFYSKVIKSIHDQANCGDSV